MLHSSAFRVRFDCRSAAAIADRGLNCRSKHCPNLVKRHREFPAEMENEVKKQFTMGMGSAGSARHVEALRSFSRSDRCRPERVQIQG